MRDLVSSYKHLNEKTEALNGLQTGIIKLGTFGTFAGSVLPDILKSFHNDYPNIIFDFYQNFYRDIEHWVSKDVIDFGITRIDEIKGFQVTRLFEDPLFVALPEGHRLSGETTLTVDMIKDEPFLVLDERDDKNFINILRSMNIELDIKFHMCDYNSLQAMVEKGMGIAIMPKLAILAGRFNIVNIPFEPKISRTIGVIYKNKNQLPAPSRIFIDYLVEHTKDFLADE